MISFKIGKKTRKFLRDWHRDLGYFFTGVILIYAISGIAINHLNDWNPSYSITVVEKNITLSTPWKNITEKDIKKIVTTFGEKEYKRYYFPSKNKIKIFIEDGTISVFLNNKKAKLEKLKKRFLLAEFNFLHYNPAKLWTYFSDIFAVALIFITISGLLIVKGKNSFSKRGWWLVLLGIIIPIVVLYLYYW